VPFAAKRVKQPEDQIHGIPRKYNTSLLLMIFETIIKRKASERERKSGIKTPEPRRRFFLPSLPNSNPSSCLPALIRIPRHHCALPPPPPASTALADAPPPRRRRGSIRFPDSFRAPARGGARGSRDLVGGERGLSPPNLVLGSVRPDLGFP
jgi:hypothetical protein